MATNVTIGYTAPTDNRVFGDTRINIRPTINNPDSNRLSYAWSKTGGGTIHSPSAAETNLTFPSATSGTQTISVTLTVTDLDNSSPNTATRTMTFRVVPEISDKSLFHEDMSSSIQGVAWQDESFVFKYGDNSVGVIDSRSSSTRSTKPIDSEYISGSTGYVSLINFETDGRLEIALSTSASDTGTGLSSGPQLTSAARTNLGIAIRLPDGTQYSWRFDRLTASDTTEPYVFSSSSVTNAGQTNNAALRGKLDDFVSARVVIADRTDANIDWANLSIAEVTDPVLPSIAGPTFTRGQTVSLNLGVATGGTSPYIYSVVGTLPTGLSYNASTQTISGTVASNAGIRSYSLFHKVTDSSRPAKTAQVGFSITITAAAPIDTNPVLPGITSKTYSRGQTVSFNLGSATSGNAPLTYTLEGTLPTGLSYSASTQTISGTVSSSAGIRSYTLTHKVTDSSVPADTDSESFTITITAATTRATVSFTAPTDNRVFGDTRVWLSPTINNPDSNRLSYSWSRTVGGTIHAPNNPGTDFTFPSATASTQTVTITLTVTDLDESNATTTGSITFRVIPELNKSSLFNENISSSIQGVAWQDESWIYRFAGGDGTGLVDSRSASTRSSSPISSVYIVGNTGYIGALGFPDTGTMQLHLSVSSSDSQAGRGSGPQLNSQSRTNLGIAIRLPDGTQYSWRFDRLTASDTTEPYLFTSSSVSNAGQANNAAFRAKLGQFVSARVVIADRTDQNIDWSNLQLASIEDPVLPAVENQIYRRGQNVSLDLGEAVGGLSPLTYTLEGTLPTGLSYSASSQTISGTVASNAGFRAYNLTHVVTDSTSGTPKTDRESFTITVADLSTKVTIAFDTPTNNRVFGDTRIWLSPTINNPDNNNVSYSWSVSGGGTVHSPTNPSTDYTAPNATSSTQTVTVTLTVTDLDQGNDTVTGSITFRVVPELSTGSLFHEDISPSTQGVAWQDETWIYRFTGDDGTGLIDSRSSTTRSAVAIDPTYVSGSSGYVSAFGFQDAGTMILNLSTSASDAQAGQGGGPQLTSQSRTNLGIAIRLPDGTQYSWRFDRLTTSDASEPYSFSSASLTSAGQANNAAFRAKLGEFVSARVVIADRTDANIDWPNLSTASDTEPKLPDVDDFIAVVGTAIDDVTLPEATGGNRPIVYSVSALPSGLSFDADTRIISGTVSAGTTARAYSITYTATDNDNDVDTSSFTITVQMDLMPTAPNVDNFTAPIGTEVNITIPEGTGGNGDLSYKVSALPAGLTFDADTRVISGTVPPGTTREDHEITLTVTDEDGDEDTSTFTITVGAETDLVAPEINDAMATVDMPFSLTLPVFTGGDGTLTYSVSGLPTGLDFDADARRISGTPTETGDFTVTYKAVDTRSVEVTTTFVISVETLSVAPELPNISDYIETLNRAVNIVLPTATGGTGIITYTVSGLPSGLSFTANTRRISGTPTRTDTVGTHAILYTATDSNDEMDSAEFSIVIRLERSPDGTDDTDAGAVISLPVIEDEYVQVNTRYEKTLEEATGDNAPFSYSVSGLPSGMSFVPSTRVVSGTPTIIGVYPVVYTVTDNSDNKSDTMFDIVVRSVEFDPDTAALSLKIVNDGYTTGVGGTGDGSSLPREFNLFSEDGSIQTTSWTMAPANVETQTLVPHTPNTGPHSHENTRNLMEETMILLFTGNNFRKDITTLERLIEAANNKSHKIYISYDRQVGDPENIWRTPVISGVLGSTDLTQINLLEKKAEMQLRVVREPWWEEDVIRHAVSVRTDVVNGQAIFIEGTNIRGTAPTPIEVEIEKTAAGTHRAGVHMYMYQDKKLVSRDGFENASYQTNTNIIFSGGEDYGLDSANSDPQGIWSDGTHMWVADRADGKLYAYSVSTKARVSSQDFNTLRAAGNDRPIGIWSDGTYMWVLDDADNRVYAYNLSSKARVSNRDIGQAGTSDDPRLRGFEDGGLTGYGSYMWVTNTIEDYVQAFRVSDQARVSAETFRHELTDLTGTFIRGIFADVNYIYITHLPDNRLYAFDRITKDREPDADVVLYDDNTDPRGVWGDDSYIWVADSNGTLHSYDRSSSSVDTTIDFRPRKYLGYTQWFKPLLEYEGTSTENDALDKMLVRVGVGVGDNRTYSGEYFLSGRVQDGRESAWTDLGPVPVYKEDTLFIDTISIGRWDGVMDRVYFAPMDGYRRIEIICDLHRNDKILDRGGSEVYLDIDRETNFPANEDKWIPGARGIGTPIEIVPGENCRLILLSEDDDKVPIPDGWTINIRYKARRYNF